MLESIKTAATTFIVVFACVLNSTGTLDAQVPIIFDTDISGDVDDVLALAMLHSLADRDECVLRAVTISKINPLTGRMVDAVNTDHTLTNAWREPAVSDRPRRRPQDR